MKNRPKSFPFGFLKTELNHFLYKRADLKKQPLNIQLSEAVKAGVMTYSHMIQFRDRVENPEKFM